MKCVIKKWKQIIKLVTSIIVRDAWKGMYIQLNPMEVKMEKKFKMKAKELEVVITANEKIFLPSDMGQVEIGTYEQTTTQHIQKDKVAVLINFVDGEVEKAQKQMATIDKQLDGMKDVEEILSLAVEEACAKQIGKGTKVFKQKMLVLNNHLTQLHKKRQLDSQMMYIKPQLGQINKELTDLRKAIE